MEFTFVLAGQIYSTQCEGKPDSRKISQVCRQSLDVHLSEIIFNRIHKNTLYENKYKKSVILNQCASSFLNRISDPTRLKVRSEIKP